MTDDDPRPTPPRACPVCGVAMQTTETETRIVHKCENCGMTIAVVLPDVKGD